jgi:hypothetical protein
MGFFKRMFTPQIPDANDTQALVDWFLKYDEKAKQTKPSSHLRESICAAIEESGTAAELQKHIDEASTVWEKANSALEPARSKGMVAAAEMGVQNFAQSLFDVSNAESEMRIFGYVLSRKFGTEPK